MIFLTPGQVSEATMAPAANVEAAWPLVCAALEEQGINGPLVQVGMAATIAAETGDFLPKREILSKDPRSPLYAVQQRYAGSGYYGRGFIQITWRANYADAGAALGLDLEGGPDMALEPGVAARIAAWFFRKRPVGGGDMRPLFRACEARDWNAVRRGVNGPGYQKDSASLARFMGHCRALAKLVEGMNG